MQMQPLQVESKFTNNDTLLRKSLSPNGSDTRVNWQINVLYQHSIFWKCLWYGIHEIDFISQVSLWNKFLIDGGLEQSKYFIYYAFYHITISVLP